MIRHVKENLQNVRQMVLVENTNQRGAHSWLESVVRMVEKKETKWKMKRERGKGNKRKKVKQ